MTEQEVGLLVTDHSHQLGLAQGTDQSFRDDDDPTPTSDAGREWLMKAEHPRLHPRDPAHRGQHRGGRNLVVGSTSGPGRSCRDERPQD